MKNFRPNQLLKGIFVLAAVFAGILFFSCEQFVAVPNIQGASSGATKSILAPEGLTASQGLKRKIALSWTPVGNAAYYLVFYADSPTSEFECVSPPIAVTSYEDSVAPGRTGYYKIQAVKSDGTKSDFSGVVKGTSLAIPVITGGDVKETSLTLGWYMENARDVRNNSDNYESLLRYEIVCESAVDTKEIPLSGKTYSHTIENLNSNTSYVYYIKAYLTTQQSDFETSIKVDAETLLSYIPQSPIFTASQGTSKEKITLNIKLPQMCQVNTSTTANVINNEDCPLFFKIYRKLASEDDSEYGEPIVDYLSYEGKTSVPTDWTKYTQGASIIWEDNDEKLERGQKYTYKVASYVETHITGIDPKGAHSVPESGSTGWMAAHPEFDVHNLKRNYSSDNNRIESISFGFNAEWESLGKMDNYNFAIKQTKKASTEEEWVCDDYGESLFETIQAVNALSKIFKDPAAQEGTYQYTFYIIPAKYETAQAAIDAGDVLDSVDSSDVLVSADTNLPKAELTAISGYKDKVPLEFTVEEGVTYKIKRTVLNKDGSPDASVTPVEIEIDVSGVSTYPSKFKYNDTTVVPSYYYAYVLYAAKNSLEVPSETVRAKTLGAPAPQFVFSALAYDSITVRFAAVNAAEKYTVTLGTAGDFGNGQTLVFDKTGAVDRQASTMSTQSHADLENGVFTVVIKKPYGYDNATLAGKPTDLVVKVESAANDSVESAAVKVNVLGPANLSVFGTTSAALSKDAITISWTPVTNAKGYAVCRTRQAFGTTEAKTDVYYVNADVNIIKYNGDEIKDEQKVTIGKTGENITLVDKNKDAGNSQDGYDLNQQRISWGLEYKYTILPLLSEEDAAEPSEFEVRYNNLEGKTASGFTQGYGIDIEASKAEFADCVKIKWKIPASAKYTNEPTLLYKDSSVGSGAVWQNVASASIDVNNDSKYKEKDGIAEYSYTPPSDHRTKKLEYMVTYIIDTPTKVDDKYSAYLSGKLDSDKEAVNTGYMFTMPFMPLKTGSTEIAYGAPENAQNEKFSESVRWKLYEAEGERKKGAGDNMGGEDPYTLYVKNLNNSSGWWPVATFDKAGKVTPITGDKYSWYSVGVANNAVGNSATSFEATVTPKDIGTKTTRMYRDSTSSKPHTTTDAYAGTHNGLLKVQRDYKHYYRIGAKRKATADSEEIETFTNEVYTYRKITDDEFAKGVTLIVADALFQAGIPKNSSRTLNSGANVGKFYIQHHQTSDKVTYGTNNEEYQHKFTQGAVGSVVTKIVNGEESTERVGLVSGWTIKMDNATTSSRGARENNLRELPWGTIKVTHETGLASYKGYVIFRVGNMYYNYVPAEYRTNYHISIQYSHTADEPGNNGKIIINGKDNNLTYNDNYDNYYTVDNNLENLLKWFPYNINTGHGSADATINTSLPTYQHDWWLDRGAPPEN